jgi:vacuolar-type H+-ATPase subunit H
MGSAGEKEARRERPRQHRIGEDGPTVLRLSELLERIRPAGAPGAAATGAPLVDVAAANELAALVRMLAELEAEADDVVAEARERADQLAAEAIREEDQIHAELPERLAVARAEVTRSHERRGETEAARLTRQATEEAERRRRAADDRLDALVDAVVDRIWALAGIPEEQQQ